MDFFFPGGSGIFQDNNAKIHRALVVSMWVVSGAWGHMSVREHKESFSHIKWSPQSPDFNPIESIWG